MTASYNQTEPTHASYWNIEADLAGRVKLKYQALFGEPMSMHYDRFMEVIRTSGGEAKKLAVFIRLAELAQTAKIVATAEAKKPVSTKLSMARKEWATN